MADIDPVCGMTVEDDGAPSTVYDGTRYRFCGPGCKERFDAEPELYLEGGAAPLPH